MRINLSSTRHKRLNYATLVFACFITFANNVSAQSDHSTSMEQVAAQASTYTMKSSLTLDKVIQEVYKDSPLSFNILRNTLIKANPLILSGNPAQRIKQGLTLSIPNHTQLVKQTLSGFVAEREGSEKSNKYAGHDMNSKRYWVRFP